jgi:DNA-binding IclR family transcriptional regulator
MTTSSHQQLLERIRSEFLEMPGMTLKLEQVMRLCGVERSMCQTVLDSLVEAKFLSRRTDGAYTRFTDEAKALPRFVKTMARAMPLASSGRRAS